MDRGARTPRSSRSPAVARWLAGTDDDAETLDRKRLQPSIRRQAGLGRMVKARGWSKPEHRDRLRAASPRSSIGSTWSSLRLARPPIKAVAWAKRSWIVNVLANSYAPFAQSWNLAGYPAAAPAVRDALGGTPLAVHLVAPEGRGRLILSVARQLEERQPWPRHAPIDGP